MKILMATADHLMIDRRILQEAHALISAGHSVTLLAGFECQEPQEFSDGSIQIKRFRFNWQDERFTRFLARHNLPSRGPLVRLAQRVYTLASKFSGFSSFEHFILTCMDEEEADVIHVHDLPMLNAGVIYKRKRNIPLVYDAHEIYYAQQQLSLRNQRRLRMRENRLIRHVDHVITVNPLIAELMATRFGIETPHVILNAAPLKPVESTDLIRKRFNLKKNSKVVIYQGWLSPERRIERLVLAAKYLDKDIVLIIVGYGTFEKELRQLVNEHRLTDRVFFFGAVPSDELHKVTCDADLGIIPYQAIDDNHRLCSPNKLFEFVVAGLPILSNDLPFINSVFTEFGNGISANLSGPEEIGRNINRILSDSMILEQLREGAGRARGILNWEVEKQKLLTIYSNLQSRL